MKRNVLCLLFIVTLSFTLRNELLAQKSGNQKSEEVYIEYSLKKLYSLKIEFDRSCTNKTLPMRFDGLEPSYGQHDSWRESIIEKLQKEINYFESSIAFCNSPQSNRPIEPTFYDDLYFVFIEEYFLIYTIIIALIFLLLYKFGINWIADWVENRFFKNKI